MWEKNQKCGFLLCGRKKKMWIFLCGKTPKMWIFVMWEKSPKMWIFYAEKPPQDVDFCYVVKGDEANYSGHRDPT